MLAEPYDDVMGSRPEDEPDHIVVLDESAAEEVEELSETNPVLGTRAARNALSRVCTGDPAELLARHRYLTELDVTWIPGSDGRGVLVLVSHGRGTATAPRTIPGRLVTVDEHAEAVRARMVEVVGALDGLAGAEAEALVTAAAFHDEGKRHRRFQARMGRGDT